MDNGRKNSTNNEGNGSVNLTRRYIVTGGASFAAVLVTKASVQAQSVPNSNPQARTPGGTTVTLTDAVQRNDLRAAANLLEQGHNVNRKNALGFTPLMIAAGLGNSQMVELLLKAGADVMILDNQMGASALHKAAQSGEVDVARLLLQYGAFINLQSPTLGHTPLRDAVWHKQTAMVKYLLEQGAKLPLQSHSGQTVMDIAKNDNMTEMVRLLEARQQADARRVESQVLMAAVQKNDVATVKRLIAQGADVNEKAPMMGSHWDGYTPLSAAAVNGQVEIIRDLLQTRANPRIVDGLIKATPGHKAGYMGHTEAARVLVQHGGLEIDAQGPYNGLTALHDAIWHGHTETARVFIEAGARLDLRTHTGKTPLELAIQYGYRDIAALIQKKLAKT